MRNRNRFIPCFLLSLALAAAGASAQEKAQSTQEKDQEKNPYVERFKQLDRNGDGSVTLAEWPLDRVSFDRVDRDKNGRLSQGELLTPNRLRDEARDEQFHALDANQDGRLSPAETNGTRLEWMDRNKDGYVSRPEYVDRVETGQNAWSPRATVRQQHRFQDLDRNRDNRLSRSEWVGRGARFDDADRNRDGVISPSEWPRR